MEPTFEVHGCKTHDKAARQALLSLAALPPDDRPILELFAELLDAAIELE